MNGKMVKWVTTFGVVTMLASAGFTATTYTETVGELTWSYTLSQVNTATVTGVTPVPETLEFPFALNGYPVVAVGASSFQGLDGLMKVVVPDSVTLIGGGAFYNCTKLGEVVCGAGLTTINGYNGVHTDTDGNNAYAKYGAFANCSSLSNVTFGASLKTIGNQSFGQCAALKALSFPDSLETVGVQCFYGCTALGSVTFGAGLKSISTYAFAASPGLKEVAFATQDVPQLVIGESAFWSCGGLERVTFSEALKTIQPSAFSSCTSLLRLDFPDSLTSIGGGAFYNCTKLGEVVCGAGLTTINGYNGVHTDTDGNNAYAKYGAFANCSSLSNVTFGASLKTIGNQSFGQCAALRELIFPESLESIGVQCFYGCTYLRRVVFRSTVSSIGVWAFGECPGLRSVDFGEIGTLGNSAFSGCISLDYAYFHGAAAHSVGTSVFGNSPTKAVVYIAEGSTGWGETAFGCAVKPESEYVAKEGVDHELSFNLPYGQDWSSPFFLTSTPDGTQPETEFLWGAPIYVHYAFTDRILGDSITVSFSNSCSVVDLAAEGTVANDWIDPQTNVFAIGSTRMRTISVGGLDIGTDYGLVLRLDCDDAVNTVESGDRVRTNAFAVIESSLVTFFNGRNEVEQKRFATGRAYGTLPEPPLNPGYRLAGWSTDDETINLITEASLVPSGEVDLFAVWEEAPRTVVTKSGKISSSATWTGDQLYKVTGDITVAAGATLTIEPGAIVKFADGKSLIVNGTLDAVGTAALPIVFTSIRDDEYGGDTNGDGDKTIPQAGSWHQIRGNGSVTLRNVSVLYSSSANNEGALYAIGGTMTVDDSVIAHCAFDCVRTTGADLTMRNCLLTDASMGAAPQSGTSRFINCVFYGLTTAVRWGYGRFSNCVFADIVEDIIDTKFDMASQRSSFDHCLFWSPYATGNKAEEKVGVDGNIWGDPQFVDPDVGDFSVAQTSPCVDAGDGTVAPELDYYGQPRMDVQKVIDTGVPDANGVCPDIGIYEVPGEVEGEFPDLIVTAVSAPSVLTVGEKAEILWEVANVGPVAASGGWRDAVEIVCANGRTFTLGTSFADVRIRPDRSAVFSQEFTVPCAFEGTCRVRVTTNKNRDLFEGLAYDNNAGESDVAEVAVRQIEIPLNGLPYALPLGASAETGFRLGSTGGTSAVLEIRGAAELSAWLGAGAMATRDTAVRSAVQVAEDMWLLEVPAQADARVVIANEGGEPLTAELSLHVGDFLVLADSLSATLSAAETISLVGNGFDESMVCQVLKDGAPVAYASDVTVANALQATAVFDLSRLAPGAYTLRLTKEGESVDVPLQLSYPSGGAKWTRALEMSSVIRVGRVYSGAFSYGNAGGAPMAAPYVALKAAEGTQIRLSEADAWTDTIELMAISDTYPASVLKPGDAQKVKFFYRLQSTKATVAKVQFSCTFDDPRPFTWDINGQYMRPSWATDEVWGLALATLKANVGLTWNAYLDRMRADCDHLMKIGQPTYRLDRIWQLEVNDALGVDHAVSTLAGGTDLARSGRGLGLSLSRTYGAAMFKRFQKGVLGYGWSDNLSTYAELQNDTTLAFHLPSGATYQFTKLTGEWAPEDARDKTKLAETASAYVLTYSSGTVQTFAKSNMRTSSIVDNQGHSLTFSYSGNNVTQVRHSDGQSLTFSYSGGLLVSIRDDQGRTVTYGYTGDLLTSVTAFNGLVTRYEYASADSTPNNRVLTKITYPDGTTKDFTFDDAGRVATASMNGNRFTTEIVRGPLGSYSVVAPNGGVTEVTVGASGETLKTVNALGQTVEQKYTADALLESVIAPSGKRNKISYNKDGLPVSSMSASGATTTFAYESAFDNLASVTDAKGHALGYGYDDKGRGETIDYVDGTSSRVVYDAKGDVVRSTNRRGESIAYTYDAQGKLLTKTWPNGRTFTLTYDGKDNVVSAVDSETGTVTMEYDDKERLTRIVHPKGRGFAYKYDEFGRTIERASLDGTKECYEYDALGRLSRVTDGTSAYLVNAYDPTTGWLLTQTYGNGTVVSNAYDILGRTIGIYHLKDGNRLAFFEYAYDIDGKCISQTTAEGVERYTYDADGQLTSVAYPDGTSETFAYDAVGNRTVANGDTYEVNNMNQYTSVGSARRADRDATFTYDLDGNLTSRTSAANGTTTYAYDVLNRLVAVTNETKNIRWSCQYDVFGNRTSVTDNGTTTEKLFVQGSLASVASEYVNDAQTVRHIMIGAVRLADVGESSAIRYYHADMLGSARLTTDAMGAELARASYKVFGAFRKSSDTQTGAGWVGTLGIEKDSTGLVFMRNRYYDEELGRFIQMDSIGLTAGDVNVYRYCGNDGVVRIDLSGNEGFLCSVARGVSAGGSIVSMAGLYESATGAGAVVGVPQFLLGVGLSAGAGVGKKYFCGDEYSESEMVVDVLGSASPLVGGVKGIYDIQSGLNRLDADCAKSENCRQFEKQASTVRFLWGN